MLHRSDFLAAQSLSLNPSSNNLPASKGAPPLPECDDHEYSAYLEPDEVTLQPVKLEERIVTADDESLKREYTVIGEADEMILVYSEALSGAQYVEEITLYDPAGKRVNDFLWTMLLPTTFSESKGVRFAFVLPEDGEYRLEMALDADSSLRGETDEGWNYLLRVRTPSYYERLMIVGDKQLNNRCMDEAITSFTLAIEAAPDLPMPYTRRLEAYRLIYVFTYMDAIYALPELPENFPNAEFVLSVFDTFEPAEQRLIISDLRSIKEIYESAIADGKIPSELSADLQIYEILARFLETREVTEELIEAFETFADTWAPELVIENRSSEPSGKTARKPVELRTSKLSA